MPNLVEQLTALKNDVALQTERVRYNLHNGAHPSIELVAFNAGVVARFMGSRALLTTIEHLEGYDASQILFITKLILNRVQAINTDTLTEDALISYMAVIVAAVNAIVQIVAKTYTPGTQDYDSEDERAEHECLCNNHCSECNTCH